MRERRRQEGSDWMREGEGGEEVDRESAGKVSEGKEDR